MTRQTRRRFLAGLGGLIGASVLGGAAWVLARIGLRGDTAAAGPTSTTRPSPSGTPHPTGVTTTVGTSTTVGPPTTSATTTSTTTEPTTTTGAPPAGGDIVAICVSAWGGAPAQGEFEEHVIERLTIHHTASLLEDNTRAPHHVRGHQRFHQRDRGWPDLAYHFIVDRNGHVYQGRPTWARGDTGTTYDPTGHFLVCCEGNFDEQAPSDEQVASLVRVLAWASVEFDVAPKTMRGHRDWASTSCPGKNLYSLLTDGSILREVRRTIRDGAPALTVACDDDTVRLVADIESGAA